MRVLAPGVFLGCSGPAGVTMRGFELLDDFVLEASAILAMVIKLHALLGSTKVVGGSGVQLRPRPLPRLFSVLVAPNTLSRILAQHRSGGEHSTTRLLRFGRQLASVSSIAVSLRQPSLSHCQARPISLGCVLHRVSLLLVNTPLTPKLAHGPRDILTRLRLRGPAAYRY